MRHAIIGVVVLGLLASSARADATVVLKDGRRVVGKLIQSGDSVGVATDEGLQIFPRDEIDRIEQDAFGRATPEEKAAYRRAEKEAGRSARPAEAVAVWQRYLAGLEADATLRAEAESQLTQWHAAAREGKVIWAGKVVTLVEREEARKRTGELLEEAVALYDRGEDRRAADRLKDVLAVWPEHPGALFYTALIYHKRQNPVAAASRYGAVLAVLPDHVPTLNNLAALQCARKQYRDGVPMIVQAAQLAPDVVTVNDNAYRALLLVDGACDCNYTDEAAKGRLRAITARMEAAMRGQGMARWGTSWVTAEAFAQYGEKNRAVDEQLLALADTVRAADEEVAVLKARLEELQRQRRTAPTSRDLVYDGDGDGLPDRIYPANVLTKDKIDLLLADYEARLDAKQKARAEQVRTAERIKAGRVEPPQDLTFVLVENPGIELLSGWDTDTSDMPSLPSLVGPTTAAELIMAIRSGRAVILADDGTFLGRISDDGGDPLSVSNGQGAFGSQTSATSLMNSRSPYASDGGEMSVNNAAATKPPRFVYEGRTLAFVTVNPEMRPRVSLADVMAVLRGQ